MLNPVEYLSQVSHEVRRVSWPTLDQTRQKTTVVLVISLGIAAYVGLLDFVFQRIMTALI